MADLEGDLTQDDIDFLASQSGLIVEIRPGDILVNKDGADQNFAITRSTDIFVPPGDRRELGGLFVACIDADEGIPDNGERFDLGPSLDSNAWSDIEAAPALLALLRHIDEEELFCESDFTTQNTIWRITDNRSIGGSSVNDLLEDAGVNIGNRELDFPRMSNPNANDPDTGIVEPPELEEDDGGGNNGTCDCNAPGAILGGPGDDNLRGTRRDDIICGFGGNDTLRGQGW